MKAGLRVFFIFYFLNSLSLALIARLPVDAYQQKIKKSEYLKGEGRYHVKEGDDRAFISRILKHRAHKDIITTALKELGLNPEEMWFSLSEKLSTSLLEDKERLLKKYQLLPDPETGVVAGSAKDKETFKKEFRRFKLEREVRVFDLLKFITTFKIKNSSRSARYKNLRYMTILAKVNYAHLSSEYYRFVGQENLKSIERIYFSSHYDVFDWSKLSVQNPKDFANVVDDSLTKWLQENLGPGQKAVEAPSENVLSRLNRHMMKSPGVLVGQVEPSTSLAEDNSDHILRSLWMKQSINVKLEEERPLFSYRKFKIRSSYLLIDLRSNEIIFAKEQKPVIFEIQNAGDSGLASLMATRIYREVVRTYGHITDLSRFVPVNRGMKLLQLTGHRGMKDILPVIDLLETRGKSLQVSVRPHLVDRETAKLFISYTGEKERFFQYLRSFHQFALPGGAIIKVLNFTLPTHFKMQNMGLGVEHDAGTASSTKTSSGEIPSISSEEEENGEGIFL